MSATRANRPEPHSRALFRVSDRDALVAGAAILQGTIGCLILNRARSISHLPALAALIAIGVWWGSNTIAHIHLHSPLFRSRRLNRGFSLYLTALLGIPQSIWRARHLWHHAGEPESRPRFSPRIVALEVALVAATWIAMAAIDLRFFVFAWLPGYAIGLLLCQLQGHFEHTNGARGGISFYSRLYNLLWFNDGFHVEHHLWPAAHWTLLPSRRHNGATVSALPPMLRFIGSIAVRLNRLQARLLVGLERLALASPRLQRFMLASHEAAFRALLPSLPIIPSSIFVVGGGLFPRTAILLSKLLPDAEITLLDERAEHLECARRHLAERGICTPRLRFLTGTLDEKRLPDCDLVIIPLGLIGDRDPLYRTAASSQRPGLPQLIVHDWIWRRRGRAGKVISIFLLKRLNLA